MNERNLIRKVLILIFLSVLACHVYSQSENIRFTNINVRNGLTANWISSLYRDHNGFIWVGTRRGLNRYDGYNVTNYTARQGDTTGITDNIINCFEEDLDSNLWVGTPLGISIYKQNTGRFEQVNLFQHNAFGCNDVNYVRALLHTSKGEMLIGTHQGIFIWENGRYTHHLIDSSNFSSPANYILSFAQDKKGNIWAGTNSKSLYCLNRSGKGCTNFTLPEIYSGAYSKRLNHLFTDTNDRLWVGTQAGLFVFNLTDHTWDSEMNRFLNEQVGNKFISGIQSDKDGKIWVATDGSGLFIVDPEKRKVQVADHQVFDNYSLSTNGIYSLLIDRDDIVWVGTYKQGLDYYKRNSQKFLLLKHHPWDKNSLISNDVNCMIEDSRSNLWFGTNGQGISILNQKTGTYRHLQQTTESSNSMSSNVVVSLFEDSRKNIWIGTYFGGLNKYNPGNKQFKVYKHSATDSSTLSDDRIWSITEDDEHNIWIGTMGGGLSKLNPQTEVFKRYTPENSNIAGSYINQVFIDSKKRMWICSTDGLCLYNKESDDFQVFNNPEGTIGNNRFGILVSAYEDSRGLLWFCTSNGLIHFNHEQKKAIYINSTNGLRSDPVNRVLEDRFGNLWISSSNGLTKITFNNPVFSDSISIAFTHYDETDGLQNNEFSETAALQTRSGDILFGGVDGVNIFNPDEINNGKDEADLVFLNLKIFNEIVTPGQKVNKRVILDKPLSNTDEIVLDYADNFFSIEFAALNYLSTEKNKYRYRLTGFDNNWFETGGNNNFATYTNLNNGEYTFEVMRANTDGSWNENSVQLKIVILPPAWKSWYAFLIYIGLLSFILFVLRYMILSKERLRVKFEHQKLEAERIHELDLAKIKFFTNVSHEFRTPLSLILSPLEKLLPKYENNPDGKYLHHIYANSRKLLYLINQLLDFRKMEISGLTYNPSHEDVISFINYVVELFNDLSENKKISLRLVTDIKKLVMLFDKDKLEKILYNLLSNAFKFTPENGLVIVEVQAVQKQDEQKGLKKQLVIKVKDNGIGIKKELISKIFTRFYQAGGQASVEDKGTGIGLSMVKEYVSAHKGTIEVESAEGVGTCFTVILPVEAEGEIEVNDSSTTTVMDRLVKSITKHESISLPVSGNKVKPVMLIVEDNDDLRAYLKDNLAQQYEIIEAENGKQGWSRLKNSMPDIVLSDIMMPELDGIELCRMAKQDKITCHIPFVFLTARNSDQYQLEGLETGADGYISKPFNLDILERKMHNLLQLKVNIQSTLNTKLQIEPKDISITSLDTRFMEKALDLIEQNIGDPAFSVAEFSKEMGISRMQLYKKLVSLTGKTPIEFIRIFRLKRAAQLLQKSQLTVSEIAYQVGFNDPKVFSRHFKTQFEMLPSRYIKRFSQN